MIPPDGPISIQLTHDASKQIPVFEVAGVARPSLRFHLANAGVVLHEVA